MKTPMVFMKKVDNYLYVEFLIKNGISNLKVPFSAVFFLGFVYFLYQ
jgi:hypothetical protein